MYVIATLSIYPHRASLKSMPGHGGIRIPPWPGIFFKLARCGYTLRVAITYIKFIHLNQCRYDILQIGCCFFTNITHNLVRKKILNPSLKTYLNLLLCFQMTGGLFR